MTTGSSVVRVVIGVIGVLMMIGGAVLFVLATPFGLLARRQRRHPSGRRDHRDVSLSVTGGRTSST